MPIDVTGAVVEALVHQYGDTGVGGAVVEVLGSQLRPAVDVPPAASYPAIAVLRFGRDLGCEPAGTVRATATGDWPTISGRPNLHAAVRRRFVTAPGQLVHRPLYGVGPERFNGKLDSPTERSRLVAAARENLMRDPRLDEVSAVASAPEAGMVVIKLNIRPTGEVDADTVGVVTEA